MLTKRELEILNFLAEGLSCPEIGTLLSISETTVITHRNNIKQKLHAKNACHMIKLAVLGGYFQNK